MKKKGIDHLLSRRETLRLIGAAGAATLVGWGDKQSLRLWPAGKFGSAIEASYFANVISPALFAPATRLTRTVSQITCVARPSLTEGPFFVDELLNRSDIRSDPSTAAVKEGAPLKLKFNVYRVGDSACTPLSGALVDIWHCDALGAYSDVSGQGNPNNIGQKFLRGYQVTDSNGSVEFTTIYPGYYTGRTTHIHYKVRLFSGSTRTYEFTSQLTFDDTLTDQVYTLPPYNTKGARGTRNNNDNIYQSAGAAIMLSLTSDGQGGYTSAYDIGLTGVPDTVTSVTAVSAASFSAGALASDGIAAIFGTGLAASAVSASAQPLPTTLGGVQVQVRDSAGTTRDAPLFFVSPAQINFQIPSGTSAGGATLTVMLNNTIAGQGTATIETVAPGLFTANASGQGVPAAIVQRNKADGTQSFEPVAQFDSAQNRFVPAPIDLGDGADQLFLVAFGTGFRSRSALSAVAASIGGTNAQVLFAGAQNDFTGLDQTNIAISRSLAGRGDVDLVFSVDGKTANTVTINIK